MMHYFTLKDLVRQIEYLRERYPDVPDDNVHIYIQRIEDSYFETGGWTTKDRIQNDSTPYDKLDPEVLENRIAAGIQYSDYNYTTKMIHAFTGVTFPPDENGVIDFMITPHY